MKPTNQRTLRKSNQIAVPGKIQRTSSQKSIARRVFAGGPYISTLLARGRYETQLALFPGDVAVETSPEGAKDVGGPV